MLESSKDSADVEEMTRRSEWLRRVPPSPSNGVPATSIKILMGDQKVSRKFATDEVLSDVTNFIGSLYSGAPERLQVRVQLIGHF